MKAYLLLFCLVLFVFAQTGVEIVTNDEGEINSPPQGVRDVLCSDKIGRICLGQC